MVQRLRYKDYQLASRPATVKREGDCNADSPPRIGLFEIESVKAFGHKMQLLGVHAWWRRAMGYTGRDER